MLYLSLYLYFNPTYHQSDLITKRCLRNIPNNQKTVSVSEHNAATVTAFLNIENFNIVKKPIELISHSLHVQRKTHLVIQLTLL